MSLGAEVRGPEQSHTVSGLHGPSCSGSHPRRAACVPMRPHGTEVMAHTWFTNFMGKEGRGTRGNATQVRGQREKDPRLMETAGCHSGGSVAKTERWGACRKRARHGQCGPGLCPQPGPACRQAAVLSPGSCPGPDLRLWPWGHGGRAFLWCLPAPTCPSREGLACGWTRVLERRAAQGQARRMPTSPHPVSPSFPGTQGAAARPGCSEHRLQTQT